MSSSSDLEVTSAISKPTQVQPDPWVPQFQVEGNYVTSDDSVMRNDHAALAIGRNITMPEDASMFASATDADLANGSLILGVRATTALSNVCHKLWERKVEVVSLSRQRDELQEGVFTLKDENMGLKKHLKRVRKMREAIAKRLIFYQDFVNTKLLELEDEVEEIQEQGIQLLKTFHKNSHPPLPKSHKRSKSL